MDKWKLRLALSILFLGLFYGLAAAQTQAEMDKKSCDEYKQSDAEMSRVYQQVISKYKADPLFIEKLRAAQRAWIVFRDAHVASRYPATEPRKAYGSVYAMCRCEALIDLTRQRADQLREWAKGAEAGDVCAGSIKIRDYTGQSTRKMKSNRLRLRARTSKSS
ncbi:MAG TPA: lysozyme inhibitor LprI family protein [Blastocatellia bacterium]|nr:lysozyme inhibitor LprI family protein [Blastocatellia bacterium]